MDDNKKSILLNYLKNERDLVRKKLEQLHLEKEIVEKELERWGDHESNLSSVINKFTHAGFLSEE